MVLGAAVGAGVVRPGEDEADQDDLPAVLRLVSDRMKANAAKDDGSVTQVPVVWGLPV